MATNIGRSLDEINQKAKELNGNIKSLTNENKLLDKSLKFDTNPLETLNKRAENTQKSITSLTQRIELLKTKQKEYDQLLASGEITQTTYDKLSTDIAKSELQLKQLNAELKQTNTTIALLPAEKFKTLGSNIENVGNKLRVVSAVAVGALAGLTALGLSAVSTADDLATISTNLGITAEELQYLNFIAIQTDVSTEKMQKSFVKVRDALGTQLSGEANSATKALDRLGISADNFESDLDGFYAVADALGKIENSTIQATLANDIFGEKIGTEMISFLTAGSDALKGYEDELTAIGVLSNDAVVELAEFDNTMNRIKQSFSQVKNELGLALLPVMEQFATFLETKLIPFVNGIVEKFSSLDTGTKNLIIGILGFTAILAPLLIIIGKMISGIGLLSGFITTSLKPAFDSLGGTPIIAILGLIAVLLTTLYAKNEKFRESVNNLFSVLSKSLEPILSLVADLFGDIMGLVTPLINALAGPLSSILEAISILLEPIADLIGYIIEGIRWLVETGLTLLGKGWLWGTEQGTTATNTMEVPNTSELLNTTSNSNVDNSLTTNNIEINIASNEYTSAEEVSDLVLQKINLKLGEAYR